MSRPWATLIPRRSSDAQNSPGEVHRSLSAVRPRSNVALSSLEEIGKRSQALLEKKKMASFLDKSKDSQEVVNLVEELRTAIVYYQVSAIHVFRTGVEQYGRKRSRNNNRSTIGSENWL